jgi:pSer/pThr/pTyr-binding forkhead associated (FHA) protein
MPRLLIEHAGESARLFELTAERPISVGRAKSSGLILDDASVSRLHAVLRSNPDGSWQIVDQDSANGVKVNGARVREALLRPNDEIILGQFRLRFEDSASRQLVSYGTTELPPRFAQALKESAYSGSFMTVGSLADSSPGQRALTSKEQKTEGRLLKVLSRLGKALARLKTLDEVTQCALDFVLEIDAAERAYAMLLEDASKTLPDNSPNAYKFAPASIRYRSGARPVGAEHLPQFTISQSIIRQVMRDGLPLLVSDAKSDPRVSASQSIVLAGIQSAMCAPLGIGRKVRGLLYADNLSRRGMFTVDELNVFALIAVQAGLAISRVRSKQESAHQVQR